MLYLGGLMAKVKFLNSECSWYLSEIFTSLSKKLAFCSLLFHCTTLLFWNFAVNMYVHSVWQQMSPRSSIIVWFLSGCTHVDSYFHCSHVLTWSQAFSFDFSSLVRYFCHSTLILTETMIKEKNDLKFLRRLHLVPLHSQLVVVFCW